MVAQSDNATEPYRHRSRRAGLAVVPEGADGIPRAGRAAGAVRVGLLASSTGLARSSFRVDKPRKRTEDALAGGGEVQRARGVGAVRADIRLAGAPVGLEHDKGVRLAQHMQVGPCIPVGMQL